MSFNNFLGALNNCFTSTFNYITTILNMILSTNWGKLLTCLIILPLLVFIIFKIFELLTYMLTFKTDDEINIMVNDKKEKDKKGDNIKKKDIYW